MNKKTQIKKLTGKEKQAAIKRLNERRALHAQHRQERKLRRAGKALRRELRVSVRDMKDAYAMARWFVKSTLEDAGVKERGLKKGKKVIAAVADLYTNLMASTIVEQRAQKDLAENLAAIVRQLGCRREDGSALPDPRVSVQLHAQIQGWALETAGNVIFEVARAVGRKSMKQRIARKKRIAKRVRR